MFTKKEPLVGAVDHDGILRQPLLVEPVQQSTDVVVDRCDAAKVVLDVTLVLPPHQVASLEIRLAELLISIPERRIPGRQLLRRQSFAHPLDPPVGSGQLRTFLLRGFDLQIVVQVHVPIDLHLLIVRGAGPGGVVIEERRRFWNIHVRVEIEVIRTGHPTPMRRLVLAHQEKRLLPVPVILEPVDGSVGHQVSHVSLITYGALGGDEVRVVVVTLSRQDRPVIETRGIRLQMPLAHERRLVAGLLQELGERSAGSRRTHRRCPSAR